MPDASELRDLAARMLWLATAAKDQHLLEWLCIRAGDYLDQATTLESAAPAEPVVQQAQQPQPDKDE